MRNAGLAATAAIVVSLLTSPAVQAAFPGANGRISFDGVASINPDGTGVAQLASPPGVEDYYASPAWSPDGRRLAFEHHPWSDSLNTWAPADLYVMDADGSDLERLTDTGVEERGPAWSPDGQRLAFSRTKASGYGDDLYVLDAEGNETLIAECTTPPPLQSACPGRRDLSWSPDGERIAFTWNDWVELCDDECLLYVAGEQVHTIETDGSGEITLTEDLYSRDPDWSPDGGRIVFERGGDIWVMNSDGSGQTLIANDPDPTRDYAGSSWSPDGSRIAYFSTRGCCEFGSWTMKADGTDRVQIASRWSSTSSWQRRTDITAYPRPGSGANLRASLVPAFSPCTAPNSTHVAPLALSSCAPPVQQSPLLTTSTVGGGSGWARLSALPGDYATAADEADALVTSRITDVRCAAAGPGCTVPGTDYSGPVLLMAIVRLTDLGSGALGTTPATVQDFALGFPIDCAATAGPAGSTCALTSSADAIVPGLLNERQRAVLSVRSLSVSDAGPDGLVDPPLGACPPTCGSGDERVYLDAGIFAP